MAPGVNLVMTIIGFTVSTMFIVFVCTRLICARIRYISLRRTFRLSSRSDPSSLERGFRGVEPLVVANFPTKKYNDPFFSSALDARCTVCLSEFHSQDTLRILPFCGHFFHSTCIDIWLQQHSTCPVCRVSLRELSERELSTQLTFSSTAQQGTGSVSIDQVRSTDNEPESLQNDSILSEVNLATKCENKQDECPSNA